MCFSESAIRPFWQYGQVGQWYIFNIAPSNKLRWQSSRVTASGLLAAFPTSMLGESEHKRQIEKTQEHRRWTGTKRAAALPGSFVRLGQACYGGNILPHSLVLLEACWLRGGNHEVFADSQAARGRRATQRPGGSRSKGVRPSLGQGGCPRLRLRLCRWRRLLHH